MKVDVNDKFNFETPEDDFDFDNFDVGLDPDEGDFPSKDRTPVEQVAGGFLSGAVQASTDPTLMKNVARKALPEGYGSALDAYDDVKSKGLGLYNELSQEMKPAILDLKRLGRRVKNGINGMLPEKISGKLDKLLAEDDLRSMEQSQEQIQNEEISSVTNQIFAVQQQREEEKEETEATEKMVDRLVETKRHATQTDQLQNVGNLLSRQVSYQDNILINYQKKSLELSYKKYFIMRDQFVLYKQYQPETMKLLRNIVKNSALPDIVKMQNTELALQMTKEKLIGKIQDKIAPQARDFLDSATKILRQRLGEKVDEFKEGVAVSSLAGDQLEMMDDMGEYGPSKLEIAGQMAGDSTMRKFGEWVGGKLKKPLSKNKEISTIGNKLMFGSENYHKILKQYMQDNEFDSNLMKFFQEVVLNASEVRRETRVGYDQMGNATDATPFDNLTRKSIVEIIPGWLSRIYQSTRELVTGQPQELMTYDVSSNSFDTVDNVANRISDMAMGQGAIENMQRNLDQLIERMGLNDKLSQEGDQKLRDKLLEMSHKDKLLDINKLMNGNIASQAGLSSEDINALSEALRNKVGIQESTDKETGDVKYSIANDNVEGSKLFYEMHRDMVALRESIPNVYEIANQFANTGNREALRRTGITEKYNDEDHVNNEFVFEKFKGKETAQKGYADSSGSLPDNSSTNLGRPKANVSRTQDTQEARETLEEILDRLTVSIENINIPENLAESLGEITFDYDRYSDIAKANSSKEEAQQILDTLNDIREFLNSGELIVNSNSLGGEATEGMINKGIGFGKKGFGKLKSGFGKGIGFIKKLSGIGAGLMTKPMTMAKNMLSKLNPFKGGIDIEEAFLPGLKDAVLTKVDLLRGQYFHPITGKVITKWEEMSEGVKDVNGKWILTKEAIRNRLVDDKGKPLDKLNQRFSKVKDFLKGGIKSIFKFGMKASPLGMLTSTVGYVKDKVTGFLSRPIDLYLLEKDPDNPILSKFGFKNGHYQDSKGNIISKPKEIKGAVYDESGENILVQADEVNKLTTRSGKSPFKGIFGKGMDMVKGAFKKAKGLVGGMANTAKNIIKGGVGAVTGMFSGGGIGGGSSNRTLNKIYRLLLQYAAHRGLEIDETEETNEGPLSKIKGFFKRMVKPTLKEKAEEAVDKATAAKKTIAEKIKEKKERTLERAGNWRDKLAGYKDSKLKGVKEKVTAVKEKVKEKGGFGSMVLGFLGKFAGMFGGILTGIKAIGTSIGTLIGITKLIAAAGGGGGGMDPTDLIPDGPDGPDGKKKGGGKGGKGGKKGWLRRAAGGLWKGVRTAGRFAARNAGTLLRLAPAAAAMASSAGSILGTIGAAVAAFVSSPVVIAATVIAVTAYVGYRIYKHYKNKLDPLQKLRFAQYGVPNLDPEKCSQIAAFEDYVKDKVEFKEGEAPAITSKLKFDKLKEIFGIDENNKEHVEGFLHWFRDRFKPVYLTHRQLCKNMEIDGDLKELDSNVEDSKKYEYARKTVHTNKPSPYESNSSPFVDQVPMDVGKGKIEEVLEEIKQEFSTVSKNGSVNKEAAAKSRKNEVGDKSEKPGKVNYQETKDNIVNNSPVVNRMTKQQRTFNVDPYVNMTDGITNVYRPKKDTRDEIVKSIYSIADELGVSASILLQQIRNHSKFDPKADGGLFGMKEDRFKELVEMYHGKYDTDDKIDTSDVFKSIYVAAEDLRQLQVQLQKDNPNKQISINQLQMAYQLGKVDPKAIEKADEKTMVKDIMGSDSNYKAPNVRVKDYVNETKGMEDDTVSKRQQQVNRRQKLQQRAEHSTRQSRSSSQVATTEFNKGVNKHLSAMADYLKKANEQRMEMDSKLGSIVELLSKFLDVNVKTEAQQPQATQRPAPTPTSLESTVVPTRRSL